MASSSWGATPKWRGHLQYEELFNDAWGVKGLSASRADKAHLLSQYVTRFFDLEQNAEVRDSDLKIVASTLFDVIGDDQSAESAFVEALKLSKRSDVQLYGYGREQIARLRSNPFDLQTASMTGEKIDVAKLRGKVVLVDIWSNWCPGCIAAMPKVQGIWEKYRDRGFEVVGVWLTTDEAKEKEQAQKYLSEKGAKYPNAVIAGQANIDFCKKYSIIGVPVTFLLGRDGKLVTNDVTGSRLEEEVKRLMEAPTKK
jgi:thiol-disulfide isomerase/thioredoxin